MLPTSARIQNALSPAVRQQPPGPENQQMTPKLHIAERLAGNRSHYSPQEYQKRVDFYKRLCTFLARKGEPLTELPQISNENVDLYDFYNAVDDNGGFEMVMKTNAWMDLCSIAVPGGVIVSGAVVRQLKMRYAKYLLEFECHFSPRGRSAAELIELIPKSSRQQLQQPYPATGPVLFAKQESRPGPVPAQVPPLSSQGDMIVRGPFADRNGPIRQPSRHATAGTYYHPYQGTYQGTFVRLGMSRAVAPGQYGGPPMPHPVGHPVYRPMMGPGPPMCYQSPHPVTHSHGQDENLDSEVPQKIVQRDYVQECNVNDCEHVIVTVGVGRTFGKFTLCADRLRHQSLFFNERKFQFIHLEDVGRHEFLVYIQSMFPTDENHSEPLISADPDMFPVGVEVLIDLFFCVNRFGSICCSAIKRRILKSLQNLKEMHRMRLWGASNRNRFLRCFSQSNMDRDQQILDELVNIEFDTPDLETMREIKQEILVLIVDKAARKMNIENIRLKEKTKF